MSKDRAGWALESVTPPLLLHCQLKMKGRSGACLFFPLGLGMPCEENAFHRLGSFCLGILLGHTTAPTRPDSLGPARSHQELWTIPISAPNQQPCSFQHHKCGHQCTTPVLSPALCSPAPALPVLLAGGSAESRQHCRGFNFDLSRFAQGRLEWWLAVSHFF